MNRKITYPSFLLLLFLFHYAMAFNTPLQADFVVAKDGSGDFKTIQSAIDASKAFPPKRVVIFIKNGVYHEKVKVPSWNTLLSLTGEDPEKTMITYDDFFAKINRGRNSTFFTYTLLVEADDFYAENLTIANTAGNVGQAVALHVEGNRCVLKHCRMLGNQDTLYLSGEHSNQYFAHCFIEGTTDFIFGSAAAVFSQCEIESKKSSYITAASTSKGKPFGFVFMDCTLLGQDDVKQVYLGRPWRNDAKTVFLRCNMSKHIRPEGWHNWGKKEAESTSFYAEYGNTGEGSKSGERVKWSHQLTAAEAQNYTTGKILGEWVLPFIEMK